MREIKFRAWDKDDNEMSYSPSTAEVEDLNDHIAIFEDIGYELMQYTGLKDKNGKEIYEGDIVKHEEHWSDGRMQSVVSWDTETAEFYPFGSSDWAIYDYEVISNIYENPELLK